MRIYILPYGNKAYFSYNKRVSGVDTAQLMQYKMLKELGHDVRMWAGFTDLHKYIDDVDFYKEEVPEGLTVKEYEKTKRQHIEESMFRSLLKFKPDVIFCKNSRNACRRTYAHSEHARTCVGKHVEHMNICSQLI